MAADIVDILTNTNQFIQLSKPIRVDEIEDGLDIPSINNNNYIVNKDSTPMVNTEVDFTTVNSESQFFTGKPITES